MDHKYIAQFKSIPEMYGKEKSGAKPNTIRKIDANDDRFKALRRGCKRISIMKSDMSESFERYITDYTEWEGYAIISWRSGDHCQDCGKNLRMTAATACICKGCGAGMGGPLCRTCRATNEYKVKIKEILRYIHEEVLIQKDGKQVLTQIRNKIVKEFGEEQ